MAISKPSFSILPQPYHLSETAWLVRRFTTRNNPNPQFLCIESHDSILDTQNYQWRIPDESVYIYIIHIPCLANKNAIKHHETSA